MSRLVKVGSLAKNTRIRVTDLPESGPGREGVIERGRGSISFDGYVASHERRTTLVTVCSGEPPYIIAHYITGMDPSTLVEVIA